MHLPLPGFEYFHDPETRRFFVATGFATGIAVAFGSPFGGLLMAFELSQPNTFWKHEGLWRSFVCCATGVFALAFFKDCYFGGDSWLMNAAVLDFGTIIYQ